VEEQVVSLPASAALAPVAPPPVQVVDREMDLEVVRPEVLPIAAVHRVGARLNQEATAVAAVCRAAAATVDRKPTAVQAA